MTHIEDTELLGVEMLTISRGKDSITYKLSDYEKYGEDATPYRITQNPSTSVPFAKFKLAEADGVMIRQELQRQLMHLCASYDWAFFNQHKGNAID